MLELSNLSESSKQHRLPDRFDSNTTNDNNDLEEGVLATSSTRHANFAATTAAASSSNNSHNKTAEPPRNPPKPTRWRQQLVAVMAMIFLVLVALAYWHVPSTTASWSSSSFPLWAMLTRDRNNNDRIKTIVTSPLTGKQCFATNEELRTAVHTYLQSEAEPQNHQQERQQLADLYGSDLESWCVSPLTDFSSVFQEQCHDPRVYPFLETLDLSRWDVSHATNLDSMFANCFGFGGHGLDRWNVSQVTSMENLFTNVHHLDKLDLSTWRISQVTSLRGAFQGAERFQGTGLGQWDVSNVQDMSFVFDGATTMDEDLSRWNVTNVRTMDAMFRNAAHFANGASGASLAQWNVRSVTNLQHMFDGATRFGQDLCQWGVRLPRTAADTNEPIYMENMFRNTKCPNWSDPHRDYADSPYCFACGGDVEQESGY